MTTDTTKASTDIERRARVMRLVNRPMRLLLAAPFPTPLSRRLMLVTHVGRRTGRIYHQPVSYVRDGDTLLTPGGGRWTRNLREREPVELRIAGRRRAGRPEFVTDSSKVEHLLGKMLAANPRLANFIPFIGRDGSIDFVGVGQRLWPRLPCGAVACRQQATIMTAEMLDIGRRRLALAAMVAAVAVVTLDTTILNVALPTIGRELHVKRAWGDPAGRWSVSRRVRAD